MNCSVFQDSRKGGRRRNQDRIGHWRTSEALLMAVADGMGGHAGGELAAQTAIDILAADFSAQAKPRLADPERFLRGAVERAHAAIVAEGAKAGLGNSPRTTIVACAVQSGVAYWSYLGDSRLYLVREGRVLVRTRDHTPVQQLVDAGRMREEAVSAHPQRNALLRCLGGPVASGPGTIGNARLASGDLVLLCTDGLWGPLTPRQLLVKLIAKDPARALPELTALAEAHGGPDCDNVSAVLMRWQTPASAAA